MTETTVPSIPSIYTLMGSNESDSENGKWFVIAPGVEIKIRRYDAKVSRKVHESLFAPYQRMQKFGGNIPVEIQEELGTLHAARGLIADWKGFVDRDQKEIPYTPEAAEKLLRELVDLRNMVAALSLDIKNFRDEAKEEIVGN